MKDYPFCVVCGFAAVQHHGYIFFEDNHEEYAGWCSAHGDNGYANPIFENRQAQEQFKQLHPIIYGRRVAGKPVVFLEKATVKEVTV